MRRGERQGGLWSAYAGTYVRPSKPEKRCKHCDQVLAKAEIPNPKDPYHEEWHCGQSIKALFEEVGMNPVYAVNYNAWSDWHHWNPEGLLTVAKQDQEGLVYDPNSPSSAIHALSTGTYAFLMTYGLVNNYLKLGRENDLKALIERWSPVFNPSGKEKGSGRA